MVIEKAKRLVEHGRDVVILDFHGVRERTFKKYVRLANRPAARYCLGRMEGKRGQTRINSYRQLGACSPTTHRHAARRSAGCCFIHSASCGAPIKQDCIETPAKSELVMICSWQFTGEERLQSTAMTLITTGVPSL